MARQKQQTPHVGKSRARKVSLHDALAATHEHTVPLLSADDTPPGGRRPSASYSRATLGSQRASDSSYASQASGSYTRHRSAADAQQFPSQERPTRRASAKSAPINTEDARYYANTDVGPIDERDTALAPASTTMPSDIDSRNTALAPIAENASHEVAVRSENASTTLFIRGTNRPLRPYTTIIPKRTRPRSFTAQFVVAMATVMVLFGVLTLASPLGRSAALGATFQSYANAAPIIPTATPRPTATPQNYGSSNPGKQAIINEIIAVFGPYSQGALNVAKCESGYDPNARNTYPIGNSHAEGVFQILYPSTWDTTSYSGYSPYNADANIKAAHQIFARDGNTWREWACGVYA